MRDITRRFVVIYRNWPVDSYDEEPSAHRRMIAMREAQLQSWNGRVPMQVVDNPALWRVMDMGDRAR